METLRTALVSFQASHGRMPKGGFGGVLGVLVQRTWGCLGLVRGLHGITVSSLSELR